MIETIVIGGTITAVTPLIWRDCDIWARLKPKLVEEFNVQLEAWGGQGFLGKVLQEGVKKVKKMEAEADLANRKKVTKEAFIQLFKDAGLEVRERYGDGHETWPFKVKLKPEDLHTARTIARAHYGAWSDSIVKTDITEHWDRDTDEDIEVLAVTYSSKQGDFWLGFEVYYPTDNLPEGLLKPGCKIVEEVSVRKSVTCEV